MYTEVYITGRQYTD